MEQLNLINKGECTNNGYHGEFLKTEEGIYAGYTTNTAFNYLFEGDNVEDLMHAFQALTNILELDNVGIIK